MVLFCVLFHWSFPRLSYEQTSTLDPIGSIIHDDAPPDARSVHTLKVHLH